MSCAAMAEADTARWHVGLCYDNLLSVPLEGQVGHALDQASSSFAFALALRWSSALFRVFGLVIPSHEGRASLRGLGLPI